MKCYKVTFNNNVSTRSKVGQFVANMQGVNESDALQNWNASRIPGERLNKFYLKFEEV